MSVIIKEYYSGKNKGILYFQSVHAFDVLVEVIRDEEIENTDTDSDMS